MRILPTLTVLAVLAVAGCSTVHDSSPKTVSSTPVAVSPKRVQQVRDDIDGLTRSGMTGAIATLTENGQTVTFASGLADSGKNVPMPITPPEQVRIGSISKPLPPRSFCSWSPRARSSSTTPSTPICPDC